MNSPVYVSSNHYDLPLCLYILYYRTGDPVFLNYARQVADKWWKGPHIRAGMPVNGPDLPGPMYTGVLGLALYGLDGHPEVFGYLDRITREWVNIRLLGYINNPNIYTDLREEGYIQLSAVTLARVLPDSFSQITWDDNLNITTTQVTNGAVRRANYLADTQRVAVQYFGRLQNADGGWRWGLWIAPYTQNVEQPFMLGIYLESVVRLHQLTSDPTVKASLASQLTRACEHLYRDTYQQPIASGYTSIPRVTLYFWPLAINAQDYQASDRHLTTSQLHAFGYAFKITGDPKYKTWGDEMWDSCYDVPGDGFSALIDATNYLKLFTMEVRSAGNYLAWRQGAQPVNPIPAPSSSPTPTPTPTPIPTPTPTPTPTPLTVAITSPNNNTTYSIGTNVTVTANASDVGGTVTNVGLYASSQLIGTATLTPYSAMWSNMAAGTYYLTAKAQDNRGLAVTSTPVTVKISKALKGVRNNRKSATDLTSSGSLSVQSDALQSTAILDSLASDLEQTYLDFAAERNLFNSSAQIDQYLSASIFLARSSAALAKQSLSSTGVIDRLNKIEAYLSFCEDLMVSNAISQQSLSKGKQVNASADVSITAPVGSPLTASGFLLSPNSSAKLVTTPSNLFSTQAAFASNGAPSYELANVNVTINGHAAALLMVSPTQINFTVPKELSGGLADVVVTCREGYISHGTVAIRGLNPTILGWAGDSNGNGAILEAAGFYSGAFPTTGSGLFALDSRTRVSIWASGLSSGLMNTNFSNDVFGSSGVIENLAESVAVEARTSDGKVFLLPVEYAGAQGSLVGLDQVNVVLIPELNGAGTVQLTLVVGGTRSNSMKIAVQ